MLRAVAAGAGCANRVHWLGFMDEEAKAAAYAAADCFVHASESEGMALAILEAMSAGLPVVATHGCYMTDAARAGALVGCASGSKALAEALSPLLADLDLARRQGRAGQAYAAVAHDWSNLARRSLQIYAGQGGDA
jgi:glycosyltransferase involved in cell wall biosynthesis